METNKIIKGLLFFTIMAGLFLSSCNKLREQQHAKDAYVESQFNKLGFCVGDSIKYTACNEIWHNVWGFIVQYHEGAGCVMSHCSFSSDLSLKKVSGSGIFVQDKYSKDRALTDSLLIWADIGLDDTDYRFSYINTGYFEYSFPAFPLDYFSFKLSVKDIIDYKSVSVPSNDVLLQEDGHKSFYRLYPEQYRPKTETENRVTVNQLLVDFTTIDLDSLRFEGKFSMYWTIDCGEEQVNLSTDSGYFDLTMR